MKTRIHITKVDWQTKPVQIINKTVRVLTTGVVVPTDLARNYPYITGIKK